jgi:Xaa-Pro aminopeptidase
MQQDHIKIEKVVKVLKQKGLDGLIIYSNGTCNILGPKPFVYFSEFRPLGPHNAAIISKVGDTVLMVEPEWDAARAKKACWIQEVRGTSNFIQALPRLMDEFKLTGKVGVVASGEMTNALYQGIKEKAAMETADDIVAHMAGTKTKRDVALALEAGRITDLGFEALLKHVRIGIKEYELLAEIEFTMRSAGADDIFNFMSSEKHNVAMHNPTDKRLSYGDIIIAEITAACEGQFVQLCRTVVLGEPLPVLTEKYDMLLRALKESLKQVKSDIEASTISQAMNKIISDAGYGKYCYPPYMRARGHGIGVGSIAPGAVIDDETEGKLEKDQVVVIHPNQYLPETGYLACGETVLVTETGFDRLSGTETKLYTKGV